MIDLVSYGRPAQDALIARIAAIKARDPLAPVTVVVSSNYSGLATRRAVAARVPLVNVRFQVAARLAELLGAPALARAGKRPLTPWMRVQAVRAALRRRPGVFASVAAHPSTARGLGRSFAELREVSESARRGLRSAGQRPTDVVALYDEFRAMTTNYFDEIDLMNAAAESLSLEAVTSTEAGAVVLYLPRKVSKSLESLFLAANTGHGAHAILGLTGDQEVDAEALALARRLGWDGLPAATPVELPEVQLVVSATEPEEEAREAIRQAMAFASEGIPLHRIAFAYSSRETYAGLLDDALNSAGVPHNSTSTRSLAQTLAGRAVLGLPRIAASAGPGDPGYARDVVMDWLTSVPVWHGGREVPSHRWDEISRESGVVRGTSQWEARLATYAANQDLEAEERAEGEGGTFRRNARWARELQQFIADLRGHLGADELAPHAVHAARALKGLDNYLPEAALENDEAQLEARERVKRQLEEIVALGATVPDEMNPSMRRAEFASALEEALTVPFGKQGKLGEGVFCGDIRNVSEMDFDVLVVLGMTEGAFPSALRDDPILSAEERARADGELPPGGDSPLASRRTYLAALHSAPRRIASAPRADLRSQRATQPSRWLLDAASTLDHKRVYGGELEEMLPSPPAWFRVVHSFEAALRTTPEPASPQEWDLRSLLRYQGRIDRHFFLRKTSSANALKRGIEARRSRSRRGERRLDGWTGKVPAGSAPTPGAARPISPTGLQHYATCPFRYFLGNVLHVGEMENPEDVVTIEPATIGSIVHEILQHFFEAMSGRPDPFAEWSQGERATLGRLAQESFATAEQRGQTGKSLTWRAEQKRILRDLELLLDRELRERRRDGFSFKFAEAAFGTTRRASGPAPMPAATLQLANGETVSFRGVVDRVDEGPDGALLITDYKTGSTRSYESLTDADPMKGGKFLQLPVYALAFRGQSPKPVRARYWFISEQADFQSKEILLDEPKYVKFGNIVNTLVETMRGGYFPAVPGGETYRPGRETHDNCAYCPYDSLCPSSSRLEAWEAAKTDPGLAAFAALQDGTDGEDAPND
ncbi:MAG: PD-(D/E)XK nuclease family protein [bacterium]